MRQPDAADWLLAAGGVINVDLDPKYAAEILLDSRIDLPHLDVPLSMAWKSWTPEEKEGFLSLLWRHLTEGRKGGMPAVRRGAEELRLPPGFRAPPAESESFADVYVAHIAASLCGAPWSKP